MKTFIYKLLENNGLSTKRFISVVGTLCLCVYTIVYNDASYLTSVVISAIGGNVLDSIYGKVVPKDKEQK